MPAPGSNPNVTVPQIQFTEDDLKDPKQHADRLNQAFANYAQILQRLVVKLNTGH